MKRYSYEEAVARIQRSKKIYYCYALIYRGKPFYVGISKTYKRLKQHESLAESKVNFLKYNTIKRIKEQGGEIKYWIFSFFNTYAEAQEYEKTQISKFGRICNNSGILTNKSEGGDLDYKFIYLKNKGSRPLVLP